MRLRGMFAALTTPMDENGGLRLDALGANLIRYNQTPLSGYLVLGSSGEAIYLDREEKLAVLQAAAAAAAPGKVLLAGTAEESLRATLAMTARAAGLGYHAAVVRTPHYYKKDMTAAALLTYYRAVADAAAIPVVLYNIPPLTGVDLGVDAAIELAQHPNIVGLKESSGSMDKVVRIAAARPEFALLVGGASTVYPALCAGAAGAILALAAAAPDACCAVYDAWRRGDHAAALAGQQALLGASKAFEAFGIAGLKAAVEAGGFVSGPARRPILPLAEPSRQAIAAAMAGLQSGGARDTQVAAR